MKRIGIVAVLQIVLALALPMFVSGCGTTGQGGSGTGPTMQNQDTLVTVATPSSLVYGTSATLTTTGGSGTGAVTFSVGSSTGCSVSGTTLSVTNASGTCSSVTATKAGDSNYYSITSVSIAVTLTKATPTLAWPTPASITNATTLAAALDATASTTGIFAYTAMISGGTSTPVTATSTLAPGSYTLTGTFTPSDANDYVSGGTVSVPLTVTQAAPTTTSVTPASVYTDQPVTVGNLALNGTNFLSTDTLTKTGGCSLASATYVSGTEALFGLNCSGSHYATGYVGVSMCRQGGSPCSNTSYLVYSGPFHQGLALGNGVLYSSNGPTVQAFQVSGTTLTKITMANSVTGNTSLIAWDNTTNDIVVGGVTYDNQGNQKGVLGSTGSDLISDIVVKDKTGCATAPNTNNVDFWDITQNGGPVTTIQVGNQPISCVMADFGTAMRSEYVVSRGGGQVTIWLLQNEAPTSGSVYFTGATPVAAYPLNTTSSGYPIIAFETGSAKGTIVVLDVADGLLAAFNQGATRMLWSLSVTGASDITKDESNGSIIVAYANVTGTATTSAKTVNALTGAAPTTLQSTSSQYPNGFVAANGYFYVSQNGTPDARAEQ